MKKMVKVLKALSDPNRLRIMKILQMRTMCVCELQYTLALAQSSISKHVKILEEADLVMSKKEGLWVNYSLCQNPENPYSKDMLKTLEAWLGELDGLEDLVEKVKMADRQILTRN